MKTKCPKCGGTKEIVGYSGICVDCDDEEQKEAYEQMDNVDKAEKELLTCFKCGDKMREGDAERWYHADQDDLICRDCAQVTKHTDTAFAGTYVLKEVK